MGAYTPRFPFHCYTNPVAWYTAQAIYVPQEAHCCCESAGGRYDAPAGDSWVILSAVTLGPHVVDVDLFPIVQSLVADRTAPVLPPGELPRATRRVVGALPPLAPVVLERRVIGRIGRGHESMADDCGPGEFPEGPMPFLIGPTGGTLRYDAIAYISFSNR